MYIVMGLPGAGKSTILRHFLEKHPEVEVVNYGDIMFTMAKERFSIESRDEMRKKIPPEEYVELQRAVEDRIVEISRRAKEEGKTVILDTHGAVKTPRGFVPGLPMRFLTRLHVDALILITAPYKDIMERRVEDKLRQRDLEAWRDLKEHDKVNKYLLAAYGAISGARIKVIENPNGALEKAVKEFERVVMG